MAPIRNGTGSGLVPKGIAEVRKGDGTIIYSAGTGGELPDDGLQARYIAGDITATDGEAVASWPDSHGDNDATADPEYQPTYRESVVNGHPAVDFDAPVGFLDTGMIVDTTQPRSVYLVVENEETQNGSWYGSLSTDGTANRFYIGTNDSDEYLLGYGDGNGPNGSATNNQYNIVSYIYGGGSGEVWENQTSQGTISYGGLGDMGYSTYIGARNSTGSDTKNANVRIAEILDYQSNHDGQTRQNIESVLNEKYGVL